MTQRKVMEEDFRKEEFRGAKVEDYEFRADGKLVRKDRWQYGIYRMVSLLGLNARDFEIDDTLNVLENFIQRAKDQGVFPIDTE